MTWHFICCIIGFSLGCLFMVIIDPLCGSEKNSNIKLNFCFVKYPKICKNCNNFAPCVNLAGEFKGGCCKCVDGSHLFSPDMSCGHFEYTEVLQNHINKRHLEKCFKK